MRLKSKLYKKEQDDIIDKIISILELDNENSIILYNLDKDIKKQTKIFLPKANLPSEMAAPSAKTSPFLNSSPF